MTRTGVRDRCGVGITENKDPDREKKENGDVEGSGGGTSKFIFRTMSPEISHFILDLIGNVCVVELK